MQRRSLFVLIAAVLLVAAPGTARSEDLSAAMLTLQDMPVGWSGGIVRPQSQGQRI